MTLRGSLSHERYCAELLAETDRFRELLRTGDLAAKVPTCPAWTLSDLARHVGGAHRWAGVLVATRATGNVEDEDVPLGDGPEGNDAAALDAWLAEGVEQTVRALREAGPEAEVWTWSPVRRARFWARRMTHETAIHRADAALATDAGYELAPEVAADCLEEWLQLCALPEMAAEQAEGDDPLFGSGRSIHLHATDTPPELNAEWVLDLTGDRLVHRRSHEKAAVALRGPLTDLLMVLYRRLPADSDRVEVLGDRALLDLWLERASFE